MARPSHQHSTDLASIAGFSNNDQDAEQNVLAKLAGEIMPDTENNAENEPFSLNELPLNEGSFEQANKKK